MGKIELEEKESSKKRFYLKWPWDLVVYIILVVVLRIFAIPFILLIMSWNKKQQPNGPEDGYCLQRTQGQLIQLVWAAIFLLIGVASAAYLIVTWSEDRVGWEYMDYISIAVSAVVAIGGVLIAIYETYVGLRDTFCPEKSQLAQSIRDQLPYPDEAPPVKELFAMVDEDLRQNGRWFGKLGIGKEWILGDDACLISRIRGVFGRNETRTVHSGDRTRVTRTIQIWIVDDRQQQHFTDLKTLKELNDAIDYLQQQAPAAIFGNYDSKEYNDLSFTKQDEEWYAKEQAYQQRKLQIEEQEREKQTKQAQNQVLTLPDGSVTSRITGDGLCQLLLECRKNGETRPFQLVPGIPFQGNGATFSRLVCFPGDGQKPVQLFLEEYSGSPRAIGNYGWLSDVSPSEAETVLQSWLRGKVPFLNGWTRVKRTGHGWQDVLEQ